MCKNSSAKLRNLSLSEIQTHTANIKLPLKFPEFISLFDGFLFLALVWRASDFKNVFRFANNILLLAFGSLWTVEMGVVCHERLHPMLPIHINRAI